MKLPTFDRISIERLSIYKGPIEQKIEPGINMVIGGNGVGKTTLVQTILFTLLGNAEHERLNPAGKIETAPVVPTNFFKGRINPEDEEHAKATLVFRVGGTTVEISRSLFRPKILSLTIDGKVKREKSEGGLEGVYQGEMTSLMRLEKFEHFVFVAANLLVFDEGRRTLTWDVEAQNRIIRLLFLTEFHSRLSELSERATTLDTNARHKSESHTQIEVPKTNG